MVFGSLSIERLDKPAIHICSYMSACHCKILKCGGDFFYSFLFFINAIGSFQVR